jgi:uncharacterized protein
LYGFVFIRTASKALARLCTGFPIIVLTGPRQSGKTTLARANFDDKPYLTLEDPDERELAEADPKLFLQRFPSGAVFDEVQRCPKLLSYLQGIVDAEPVMGKFVLTGSQQFDLMANVTQSLAGRAAMLQLLPLSQSEILAADIMPHSLEAFLLRGGYPALYQRKLSIADWMSSYVATYIERDVRQLLNVRNLGQFQKFIKMCASRSGQLLNLTSLATDCGLSANTAREWIHVLEASYLIQLVHPYYENFGKRLIKAPKLYFIDVGLMCYLLGIQTEAELSTHAARGAIFETAMIGEFVKSRAHNGERVELYFWRDVSGLEIDLIYPSRDAQGSFLQAVEFKSGVTFVREWAKALKQFNSLQANDGKPVRDGLIVYGGDKTLLIQGARVMGWKEWGVELSERAELQE